MLSFNSLDFIIQVRFLTTSFPGAHGSLVRHVFQPAELIRLLFIIVGELQSRVNEECEFEVISEPSEAAPPTPLPITSITTSGKILLALIGKLHLQQFLVSVRLELSGDIVVRCASFVVSCWFLRHHR